MFQLIVVLLLGTGALPVQSPALVDQPGRRGGFRGPDLARRMGGRGPPGDRRTSRPGGRRAGGRVLHGPDSQREYTRGLRQGRDAVLQLVRRARARTQPDLGGCRRRLRRGAPRCVPRRPRSSSTWPPSAGCSIGSWSARWSRGIRPPRWRGPTHVVKRGKTPVLQPGEVRLLLDSIDTSAVGGLRDRALIGRDDLQLRPGVGRREHGRRRLLPAGQALVAAAAREGRQAPRPAGSPQGGGLSRRVSRRPPGSRRSEVRRCGAR